MLSMIVLCSCSIDVDYIYYGFILENKTGRTVTVVWDVNRDCADTFVLSSGGEFKTGYDRYPPVIINSATITFKDGKVLKCSSQDEGRSLCNSKYYRSFNAFNSNNYVNDHFCNYGNGINNAYLECSCMCCYSNR